MAHCRTCKKSRVGRRKTTRLMNKGSIINVAKRGLQVYAGQAIGKALVNNVGPLSDNPIFGIVAQLGVAVVLSGSRSALQKDLAVGMAVNSASMAVNTLAPNLVDSIGITGPWGSYINPGVSGVNGKIGQPIIRVQ